MKKHLLLALSLLLFFPGYGQNEKKYTEKTPSFSEYFSWINNTNEGSTEKQTLENLAFFEWLKNEYGMVLDIYAFDAGLIDGKGFYGSMKSERFKKQFPNGLAPIYQKAKSIDTRLGCWGGPDGFGNSVEESQERIRQMSSLCKDYEWALFKFDAVCGGLRPEKYDDFDRMMTECRKYSPDLILLNHRLKLGPGIKHATTYLWQGAETYIDVHMPNWATTAPHHRARALSRDVPPNLSRLTEDHGVCISSCLDYWEDDLILQAFNRNLILSPQIYGNPWLLNDDEFPKLAFIFNLHRKYRDILVNGILLPEEQYGYRAVSRGSSEIRFITLRNLTWEPVKYRISLDKSIGLEAKGKVQVVLQHPYIKLMGDFKYGQTAEIEVLPFRSCLVKVTAGNDEDLLFKDKAYEIIQDVPGKPVTAKILTLKEEDRNYHHKLPEMEVLPQRPGDYNAMYYATAFTADNNALECRSVERSGPTRFPAVQAARDAFFNQECFVGREIWDKYLFDGDPSTSFSIRGGKFDKNTMFCLDLGESIHLDRLVISSPDIYSIFPLEPEENTRLYVSDDLVKWKGVNFLGGTEMKIDLSQFDKIRYVRFMPIRMNEIRGYAGGKEVSREKWGASNRFSYPSPQQILKSWKTDFTLDHVSKGAYLCVAFNGVHGPNGVWAGMKIGDRYYGAKDRSSSFFSNSFENPSVQTDRNNTFYFPVTEEMEGKKIEIYGFALKVEDKDDKIDVNKIHPEVFITAYPIPFEEKTVTLKSAK